MDYSFQTKLAEQKIAQKEKERESKRQLVFGTTYATSEEKVFATACMCLEACLKINPQIKPLYDDIQNAWAKTGMESMIEKTINFFIGAEAASIFAASHPAKWLDNAVKYPLPENEPKDAQAQKDEGEWWDAVDKFVKFGFNRESDIEENTLKVAVSEDNPSELVKAITLRSLMDYLVIDIEELDRKRTEPVYRLMNDESKPKSYYDRKFKNETIAKLQKSNRTLIKDETLYGKATLWYKARVMEKTLREAANKERLDPYDLTKRIRICDAATSYHF